MPLRAALIALSIVLAGCTEAGPAVTMPPAAAAPAPEPRLWYVGLGLFDESWSQNDVAELADVLQARVSGYQVMPIVLSNGGGPRRLPAATRANIDQAFALIAQRRQPGDLVLTYVSTHGAPGALASQRPGGRVAALTPDDVAAWLDQAHGADEIVILSACFSGSFVPPLRAPDRIIFTAARADRTSFGCRAGAAHTVFGQALLHAFAVPHRALASIVEQVRAEVRGEERRTHMVPPSEPQIWVGAAATSLFAAPDF